MKHKADEGKDAKKQVHKCRTLAFTIRKLCLVWLFAGFKVWEGRLWSQVMRRGGLPCSAGCCVCLFAGHSCTWHRVLAVVVVADPAKFITAKNWTQFAPWVKTRAEAVAVYTAMDDGHGFVFMHLEYPFKHKNIGRRPDL